MMVTATDPDDVSVEFASAQRPWCKLHGRSRVPKPERRGGCRRGVA